MTPLYFASGVSAPADLRGFARIGHPLGVSLPALSAPAVDYLCSLAGRGLPVMADNGAFSEVEMGEAGPVVVAPIDEQGWAWRMALYRRLARALGPSLWCVAPDRVGDQVETLARLRRWARSVRKVRRLGARVIVPIQRGELSAAAFDRACGEALGFTDFVRAIPGNKAAMPPAELEGYLRKVRPAAVHVLGAGPKSPRFAALADVLRRLTPDAAVSCDSNLIAAHVGRSNGPGGAPRALTAIQHGGRSPWQDFGPKDRSTAIVLAFGPGFWFQRMRDQLAAQGIILRGFERVDDGLEVRGFELTKPRTVQLGLFDGAEGEENR